VLHVRSSTSGRSHERMHNDIWVIGGSIRLGNGPERVLQIKGLLHWDLLAKIQSRWPLDALNRETCRANVCSYRKVLLVHGHVRILLELLELLVLLLLLLMLVLLLLMLVLLLELRVLLLMLLELLGMLLGVLRVLRVLRVLLVHVGLV
jgi:hypothetical protein